MSKIDALCLVDSCDMDAAKRSMCHKHYRRWRLYGDPTHHQGPLPGRSVEERFMEKFCPVPETGCWLWTAGIFAAGYGCFSIANKPTKAHRYSYELFNGPIPTGVGYHGTCVLHICDQPLCVNPEHLVLGTVQDNNLDKMKKGRQKGAGKGEEHHMSKITEAQTIEILSWTGTQQAIATRLGVSQGHVSDIQRGIKWPHLNRAEAKDV